MILILITLGRVMAGHEDVESEANSVNPQGGNNPAPIIIRADQPQVRYVADGPEMLGQYPNEVTQAVVQDRDRVLIERDNSRIAFSEIWDMFRNMQLISSQLANREIVYENQLNTLREVVASLVAQNEVLKETFEAQIRDLRYEKGHINTLMYDLYHYHERKWGDLQARVVNIDEGAEEAVWIGRMIARQALQNDPGYTVGPTGEVIQLGVNGDVGMNIPEAEPVPVVNLEENQEDDPEEDPEEDFDENQEVDIDMDFVDNFVNELEEELEVELGGVVVEPDIEGVEVHEPDIIIIEDSSDEEEG